MRVLKRLVAAMVLSCMSEAAAAQELDAHHQPWWDSPWGEEDTIGALNNLSPEIVAGAAKLVTAGKVYQLGVKTGPETPAYGSRVYSVERTGGGDLTSNGSNRITSFDEKVSTSMGIGTQIDGLAHLGVDSHAYNGIPYTELKNSFKLDLASIPPIVSRGVLIDMTKHFGKLQLDASDVFNSAEIKAAAKEQGVEIRKGDVVLFHTGWMDMSTDDPTAYRTSEPGIGEDGAIYLADLGVVAVGADNIALEHLPAGKRPTFIVHQTLLAKRGVYILEAIDTRELAKDGAREFLFVAAPPRMEGTVQIIVNPVAIR
ncbi:MAG: cyclase family protein [Hyphomonadaceae bacterium]